MRIIIFLISIFSLKDGFTQHTQKQNIDTVHFFSKEINDKVNIYVHKPLGYDTSTKKYPLLYQISGGLDLTNTILSNLHYSTNYIPEFITISVVLPTNLYFIPAESGNIRFDTMSRKGRADEVLMMFEKELFPKLKAEYRILDFTLLVAHSFPAATASYFFSKNPKLFNAIVASSPAIVAMPKISTNYIPAAIKQSSNQTRYLYLAAAENDYTQHLSDAFSLRDTIKRIHPLQLQWKFDYISGLDHNTIFPIALYYGLLFIFKHPELSYLKQ